MSVNWEARRRRIAEFKHLNATEITPQLIAEKAHDLSRRFGQAAIGQAEYRGRESSTEKVRAFWQSVAAHLTAELKK